MAWVTWRRSASAMRGWRAANAAKDSAGGTGRSWREFNCDAVVGKEGASVRIIASCSAGSSSGDTSFAGDGFIKSGCRDSTNTVSV